MLSENNLYSKSSKRERPMKRICWRGNGKSFRGNIKRIWRRYSPENISHGILVTERLFVYKRSHFFILSPLINIRCKIVYTLRQNLFIGKRGICRERWLTTSWRVTVAWRRWGFNDFITTYLIQLSSLLVPANGILSDQTWTL